MTVLTDMKFAFTLPFTRYFVAAALTAARGKMSWDLLGKWPLSRTHGYAVAGLSLAFTPVALMLDLLFAVSAALLLFLIAAGWAVGKAFPGGASGR